MANPVSNAHYWLSGQLAQRGRDLTPEQVRRRYDAGLYPALVVERRGRGHSDRSRYPSGTVTRALAAEELIDERGTFAEAAVGLLFMGFRVEPRALRPLWRREIRKVRKALSSASNPEDAGYTLARFLRDRARRGTTDTRLYRAARVFTDEDSIEQVTLGGFTIVAGMLQGEGVSAGDLQRIADLAGLMPVLLALGFDLEELATLLSGLSLDEVEATLEALDAEALYQAVGIVAALRIRGFWSDASDEEMLSVALGILVIGREFADLPTGALGALSELPAAVSR